MIRSFLLLCSLVSLADAEPARILVYTRNHVTGGGGFVHDNIATSVAAVKEIGAKLGATCDVSEDPAVFTDENLARYQAIVFSNSNNEAFSAPEQSAAFVRFVRKGGGFVGIHSASGSERDNPEFRKVIGGTFLWHPPIQPLQVIVKDAKHPSTAHLPEVWEWRDEGYMCKLVPGLHVLLELDLTAIATPPRDVWKVKVEGDRIPLAWCQEIGEGRSFYTALGHEIACYANPVFRRHLEGGISWALGKEKPEPGNLP